MNQVIIYGVNQWGIFAYFDYCDKVNVRAYVDENKSKTGTVIYANLPIIPLDEITADIPVVIATPDDAERKRAVSFMQKAGVKEIRIYPPPPRLYERCLYSAEIGGAQRTRHSRIKRAAFH